MATAVGGTHPIGMHSCISKCCVLKLPHISDSITGREWLIRSHSSARFCFELSGNSN